MTNQDIARALQALTPGAQWNIRGNVLTGIEWLDIVQIRPTDVTITAWIAANPS